MKIDFWGGPTLFYFFAPTVTLPPNCVGFEIVFYPS